MRDEITRLNADALWDKRNEVLAVVDGVVPEMVAHFKDYLDHLANGGKTASFLAERSLTWQQLSEVYRKRPDLYVLFTRAKQLGESFRQLAREDEADRRGMDGVDKPVYQGGHLVGHVREYSDTMLALQLKAGNPDKYADRQKVEHRGVVFNMTIEGVVRRSTPPEPRTIKVESEDVNKDDQAGE